jgi:hypothetical protein
MWFSLNGVLILNEFGICVLVNVILFELVSVIAQRQVHYCVKGFLENTLC